MRNRRVYPCNMIRCRPASVTTLILILLAVAGCGGQRAVSPHSAPVSASRQLALMRYSIQVGAFSNQTNAVRMTQRLRRHGINAYHFLHSSGLYKVRFGNYASKNAARSKAEALKNAGTIDRYYIVSPRDYHFAADSPAAKAQLRQAIVSTAERYIGVPYRWGGQSARTGFDCSGLTMVVYRLNGLDLPRSSRQQWRAGRPVSRRQLARGDLVFFATSGGRRISHVGIYTGNGKFLHAPGRGRTIQMSSLSNSYYKRHYRGARSYL